MSASFLDTDENDRATDEAMRDPQPGDRFHEMYSFWAYVVAVEGDIVTTMEASPPCRFPDDAQIRRMSREAFRRRFAYGEKVGGYWVCLSDRGNNVEGWLESKEQAS